MSLARWGADRFMPDFVALIVLGVIGGVKELVSGLVEERQL